MSTPVNQKSKPNTRSASKKQATAAPGANVQPNIHKVAAEVIDLVDLGESPQLHNRKRKVSAEKHTDEPAAKRMADNQILEAINGIKASMGSMEKQMRTFSTKADLNTMLHRSNKLRCGRRKLSPN